MGLKTPNHENGGLWFPSAKASLLEAQEVGEFLCGISKTSSNRAKSVHMMLNTTPLYRYLEEFSVSRPEIIKAQPAGAVAFVGTAWNDPYPGGDFSDHADLEQFIYRRALASATFSSRIWQTDLEASHVLEQSVALGLDIKPESD